MAKVEVVKVTHTYIIEHGGEETPEIPASHNATCANSGLTRRASDDQGLFRISERGHLVKVEERHTERPCLLNEQRQISDHRPC